MATDQKNPKDEQKAATKDSNGQTKPRFFAKEISPKNGQAFWTIIVLMGLGFIFIVLYSIIIESWTVGSIAFLTATASLLFGISLGFLFGIPQKNSLLQKNGNATNSQSNGISQDTKKYKANTALEKISDWLTTIIIGVSLSQISNIPSKLQNIAKYIEKNHEVLIMLIILHFAICGFLFSYLWTRLYLATEFEIHEHDTTDGY